MSPRDKTSPRQEAAPRPATGMPIRFLSDDYFIGHNIYHYSSVLLRKMDLGGLAETTTALAGTRFALEFLDRFLGLKSPVPRNGLKKSFIARLQGDAGAGFDEVLLEAVLAVEIAVAFAMREFRIIPYARIERYEDHTFLVWNSEHSEISLRASDIALLGVLELLPKRFGFVAEEGETFAAALKKLQSTARGRYSLSSSSSILKLAAQKRGIPCEILAQRHLMLGQGNLQQHFFSSTTSMPAFMLHASPHAPLKRLAELGLPVPRQIRVRTLEAAQAAARKIGFPLNIRPLGHKESEGVSIGLDSPRQIEPAFERARQAGKGRVVVENFEPGQTHRLLVIDGKFIAAASRKAAFVTGDGHSSVAQLLAQLNADPVRDDFRLYQVKKDADLAHMLEHAGLDLNDVPVAGREVVLRSETKIARGGVPIDMTEQVHADNRELAERAAVGVGLEVAGIDFVSTDISRSYREIGGVISAINPRPEFRIHTWPKEGKGRDVAGKVLKLFFPGGKKNGRIPIISIAGDKATGTTARVLDMLLRGAGHPVGLALRERAFVNGNSAEFSKVLQKQAPRLLLRDPKVGILVSTVSPRLAVKRGLLFDACAVTVIMDKRVEADTHLFHLGLDILERATTDCFVVGAGNTVVLNRLRELGTRRLILVSNHLNDPALEAHLNAGHAGVTMMWQDGKTRIAVFAGTELKASFKALPQGPRDGHSKARRMKNGTMFAIGAAIGLGLSSQALKNAFRNAPEMIPEIIAE